KGLTTNLDSVRAVSRMLASATDRPCAVTKNGTPHSSATVLAENRAVKWVQKPSLTPALDTVGRVGPTANAGAASASAAPGVRTPETTTAATIPKPASTRNVGDHPCACSSQATGIAVAS